MEEQEIFQQLTSALRKFQDAEPYVAELDEEPYANISERMVFNSFNYELDMHLKRLDQYLNLDFKPAETVTEKLNKAIAKLKNSDYQEQFTKSLNTLKSAVNSNGKILWDLFLDELDYFNLNAEMIQSNLNQLKTLVHH